jgi:hypothetical protein
VVEPEKLEPRGRPVKPAERQADGAGGGEGPDPARHGRVNRRALRRDTATRTPMRAHPEGKEGIAAFLEKRKPNWQ